MDMRPAANASAVTTDLVPLSAQTERSGGQLLRVVGIAVEAGVARGEQQLVLHYEHCGLEFSFLIGVIGCRS